MDLGTATGCRPVVATWLSSEASRSDVGQAAPASQTSRRTSRGETTQAFKCPDTPRIRLVLDLVGKPRPAVFLIAAQPDLCLALIQIDSHEVVPGAVDEMDDVAPLPGGLAKVPDGGLQQEGGVIGRRKRRPIGRLETLGGPTLDDLGAGLAPEEEGGLRRLGPVCLLGWPRRCDRLDPKEWTMGLIKTEIVLSNPRNEDLRPLTVEALVDTGAIHLCVPQHIAVQLDLKETSRREVKTADGKIHSCSYVGPVEVKFENRECFTGALVLGDTVLLGAVPMEDLDLVLSPAKQTVEINPDSPNVPSSIAMGES